MATKTATKPKPTTPPATQALTSASLQLIPLTALTLSALNPRGLVTEPEIAAMAASIAEIGLLQNLIGMSVGTGAEARIEIVGGGKRLRALQQLANGTRAIDMIPVLVTDDPDTATAMAGTENEARTPLHPADEIGLYASLYNRGSSCSVIAATYAKTENHVRRMLKLADLPEPVLISLRAGRISLDQARALTLAETPKLCIEALGRTIADGLDPQQIRQRLTPDTIRSNDRRIRYVGLPAYLAAGGGQTMDLFEERSYLTSEAILNDLFAAKGHAETEALRLVTGWKWATFVTENWVEGKIAAKLTRIDRIPADLPEGDEARLQSLHQTSWPQVLTDDEASELDDLRDRKRGDYSDEDRVASGIICYVQQESLAVWGAFRKPEDAAGGADATPGSGSTTGTATAAESKGLPGNLLEDLSRIRLAALQTAALDTPGLLLDLLAFQLSGEAYSFETALALHPTAQKVQPDKPDGTQVDARIALPERPAHLEFTPAAFTAFRNRGQIHRDRVLTEGLARLITTTARHPLEPLLASLTQPDIRALWTPTAAGFFSRLPVPMLDAIWADLAASLDDTAKQWGPLKKPEKAKALDRLFNDPDYREALGTSREMNRRIDTWVPDQLLFAAVAGEQGEAE